MAWPECSTNDSFARATIEEIFEPDVIAGADSWAAQELRSGIFMSSPDGRFEFQPLLVLLLFVPSAIVLEIAHASPPWIFATAALAIVPLAGLMGRATESLSERMGPGLGGLMNASFGNAAELIIAFMALQRGLHDVVKASITGAVLGNILLVLGAAVLAGGLKRERQTFNPQAALSGASMMFLALTALVVPDIFHLAQGDAAVPVLPALSIGISIILLLIYGLSLVFQLRTHSHIYQGEDEGPTEDLPKWTVRKATIVLLGATLGVVIVAGAVALVGGFDRGASGPDLSELAARAKSGEAQAQLELGTAYAAGSKEVPAKPAEGYRWIQKAAEQGLPEAQEAVGRMLLFGIGVPADPRAAMGWYEKAEALRPTGNDDALLRWNTCVRLIRDRRLEPALEERGDPPLE